MATVRRRVLTRNGVIAQPHNPVLVVGGWDKRVSSKRPGTSVIEQCPSPVRKKLVLAPGDLGLTLQPRVPEQGSPGWPNPSQSTSRRPASG